MPANWYRRPTLPSTSAAGRLNLVGAQSHPTLDLCSCAPHLPNRLRMRRKIPPMRVFCRRSGFATSGPSAANFVTPPYLSAVAEVWESAAPCRSADTDSNREGCSTRPTPGYRMCHTQVGWAPARTACSTHASGPQSRGSRLQSDYGGFPGSRFPPCSLVCGQVAPRYLCGFQAGDSPFGGRQSRPDLASYFRSRTNETFALTR